MGYWPVALAGGRVVKSLAVSGFNKMTATSLRFLGVYEEDKDKVK